MTYARYVHSCAMIRKDDKNPSRSAIVVSGDATNSVEILDENSSMWRLGPYLPVSTCCATLVEDPRGGVILIGGSTSSGLSTSLYQLKHGGLYAKWELMAQKLRLGNYYFAAFLIPDILVQNCTLA
jgi:hypothetical protein